MGAQVSNCGGDENGRAYGGVAGDQTGREYYVRPWYDFGQVAVYRHPNKNARALIAQLAREAAENDLIGYDQSQRLTFRDQLRKVGYHPKDIKVRCETDCSASTAAIIEAVGKLLGDDALYAFDSTLSTHYMDGPLQAAGFQKLTASKYTRSGDCLVPGDICLRPSSHVNIVVSGGTSSASTGANAASGTVWAAASFDFLILTSGTNVRSDPSMSDNVTGQLSQGVTIHANAIGQDSTGRIWARYLAASGSQRYVSLGIGHDHVRMA